MFSLHRLGKKNLPTTKERDLLLRQSLADKSPSRHQDESPSSLMFLETESSQFPPSLSSSFQTPLPGRRLGAVDIGERRGFEQNEAVPIQSLSSSFQRDMPRLSTPASTSSPSFPPGPPFRPYEQPSIYTEYEEQSSTIDAVKSRIQRIESGYLLKLQQIEESYSAKLKEANGEITLLRKEMIQQREQSDRIVSKAKKEYASLGEALSAKKSHKEKALKEDINALEDTCASLRRTAKELRERCATAEVKVEQNKLMERKLRARCEELQEEKRRLANKLNSVEIRLQLKVKELETTVEKAENLAKDKGDAVQEKEKEIVSLKEELDRATTNVEVSRKEAAAATDELAKYRSQYTLFELEVRRQFEERCCAFEKQIREASQAAVRNAISKAQNAEREAKTRVLYMADAIETAGGKTTARSPLSSVQAALARAAVHATSNTRLENNFDFSSLGGGSTIPPSAEEIELAREAAAAAAEQIRSWRRDAQRKETSVLAAKNNEDKEEIKEEDNVKARRKESEWEVNSMLGELKNYVKEIKEQEEKK
eukprot:g3245.t1